MGKTTMTTACQDANMCDPVGSWSICVLAPQDYGGMGRRRTLQVVEVCWHQRCVYTRVVVAGNVKKISTETHNHVQSLFMGPTSECRSLWNAEFYAPVDSESARMCFGGFCRRTRLVGCFFFFFFVSSVKRTHWWWLFVCWTFSSPCLSEQGL